MKGYEAIHEDTGETMKKGTLFFWNIGFNVSDYKNAFNDLIKKLESC